MHRPILTFLGAFIFAGATQAKQPVTTPQKDLQDIRAVTVYPMPAKNLFLDWEGGTAKDRKPGHQADLRRACYADEEEYLKIQYQILKPWMDTWRDGKTDSFFAKVSSDFKITNLEAPFVADQKFPRFQTLVKKDGFKKVISGAAAVQAFKGYATGFSKIEDVEIQTFEIGSSQGQRDDAFNMKHASLYVRMDLRGYMGAKRVQDLISARLEVKKQKDGTWKMTGLLFDKWNRLEGSGVPAFKNTTAQLDGLTVYQRKEAIRRGGYALSLADLDGDHQLDMVVGAMGAMGLFKGDGAGGFKKQDYAGIENHSFVKSSVVADFSNSGRQDLLLVRFVPTESDTNHRSDIILYKNEGQGKFTKVKLNKETTLSDYAMPVAAADFNKDSLLDFYVGFPGAKDFTHIEDLTHADGMKVQGMYWNQGKLNFRPELLKELDPKEFGTFNHRQKLFPHSALAADINSDSYPDLIVMDDRGNLSPTYLNNKGDGSFTQVAERLNTASYEYGMGSAVGDFDGDGVPDLLMTNVNFVARERLQRSCLTNWDHNLMVSGGPGLKLLKGTKDGKFIDVTAAAGLEWAGEGLAGVEFVDYNGDGLQDIFVNNGLWSGTDRSEDLASYFVRAEGEKVGGERALKEVDYSKFEFMKVLSQFQGSLHSKSAKGRLSMAGFQRKRLFRNDGKGHFVEVAFMEGIDSISDGYNVAKGDINGDGVVDLVLRNADPGTTDVNFSPIEMYTNQNPEGNNWLKIGLEGNKSNRDGIGTKVTVLASRKSQAQEVIANNGCVQSEKALYFGVGRNHQVDLKVEWPSGVSQSFKNVKVGNIRIVEGKAEIQRIESVTTKKIKAASLGEF